MAGGLYGLFRVGIIGRGGGGKKMLPVLPAPVVADPVEGFWAFWRFWAVSNGGGDAAEGFFAGTGAFGMDCFRFIAVTSLRRAFTSAVWSLRVSAILFTLSTSW